MNKVQETTQDFFSQWRGTISNQSSHGSKEAFKDFYESLRQNPEDLKELNLSEQQLKKLEIAKEFHGYK